MMLFKLIESFKMYKIVSHPLIDDKLTKMRKISCNSTQFKNNLSEITYLMAYEATKNFSLIQVEITTPITTMLAKELKDKITIIPILRAGLGMVDAVNHLIPTASIGHIGLYRDEKNENNIVKYYCKLPKNIKNSNVLLLDPMLATGESAIKAIDIIKELEPKSITFIGIVGAPEGLTKLQKKHPKVDVYLASLDEKLNDVGYITPGLGDAGDRIFGTK